MEKKITVKEFVEKYDKLGSKAKADFLQESLAEKYVGFLDKVAIANTAVVMSSTNKETGMIEIKSPKRYVVYVLMVINKYMNMNVDFNNIYEEYDLLQKHGLVDAIMGANSDGTSVIPARELAEMDTVMKMAFDDFMTNKTNTQNFVTKLIGTVTSALSDKIDGAMPMIEQLVEEAEKDGGSADNVVSIADKKVNK